MAVSAQMLRQTTFHAFLSFMARNGERHCHKYLVLRNKYKKILTTCLLESPRLFDFGKFSYLHVIRTPRLLETSE